MHYYMPTKVYDEENAVANHPEVFQKAGSAALLVTGAHSAAANGSLADVTGVLSSLGIRYRVFDRVEQNPSTDTVMEAAKEGLAFGADFVVDIGGGSPMDAAKAIALMMTHPEEGADYLYEKGGDGSRLPLILIPTTCGTGSEVTPVSVLTRKVPAVKGSIPFRIFADTALIDGKYLAAASDSVLRNTAVDALGHLWESWLNADATPYSRMAAEAGLAAWRENKGLIFRHPADLTSKEQRRLMRASAFAGMAIAQTGTSLPHGLSYHVTVAGHIPHGKAIGYFEAGYLAQADEKDRQHLLAAAGFASLEEWQDFYAAACGGELLPRELLLSAVDSLLASPAKLKKAPFAADRETLLAIAFFGRKD